MVWQKDRTTGSKNMCLGKLLERAGKLQTQHRGTATISANYTHRPRVKVRVRPTSHKTIENQGLGILHSRHLIANEGGARSSLPVTRLGFTHHLPQEFSALSLQLFLQIPPKNKFGVGLAKGARPAGPGKLAGMGDWGAGRGICSLLCFSKAFCLFTSWCLFHNSTPDAVQAGERDRESELVRLSEDQRPPNPVHYASDIGLSVKRHKDIFAWVGLRNQDI